MPGIIVSRPIFNTLFKLAHEEGLSINAYLTRLLERTGPDAAAADGQGAVGRDAAVAGEAVTTNGAAVAVAAGGSAEATVVANAPDVKRHDIKPITYEDEGGAGDVDDDDVRPRGRRIGNSVWDKVVSMEGHRFSTSRGKKFSYKVTGEYVVVRQSQARIPRSQFDKAMKMWPVTGPSKLVGVYAPSVVWAVMKELTESSEDSAEAGANAEEPALA